MNRETAEAEMLYARVFELKGEERHPAGVAYLKFRTFESPFGRPCDVEDMPIKAHHRLQVLAVLSEDGAEKK